MKNLERTTKFLGGLFIVTLFFSFIIGLVTGIQAFLKFSAILVIAAVAGGMAVCIIALISVGIDLMYNAITGKSLFGFFY